MIYKFEKLEVCKLAIAYNELCYEIADSLPVDEKFNLNSQLKRAATSIALNIAEGSTSQSDSEQVRFLGYALRSFLEVIACLRLIEKKNYMPNDVSLKEIELLGNKLFVKLQAFRSALQG